MDLNQVTLPSKDLSESVPFYKKLGLILIVDAQPDYVRFVCPEGNATFSLHKTRAAAECSETHIYFECAHLDKMVEKLQIDGVIFDQLPTDQPWLWREARLKDPDKNSLVLYTAGKNRKNPPWRIDLEKSVPDNGN